jgi:hypothetical protein
VIIPTPFFLAAGRKSVSMMDDKRLRRLSRTELLEILVEQGRQIEELQKQLADAKEQLEAREIKIANAGSMAEAALKLNHVFEDIEAAGKQYLYNLEQMNLQQQAVQSGWEDDDGKEKVSNEK